jgi:hypothetical protein
VSIQRPAGIKWRDGLPVLTRELFSGELEAKNSNKMVVYGDRFDDIGSKHL